LPFKIKCPITLFLKEEIRARIKGKKRRNILIRREESLGLLSLNKLRGKFIN